MRVPAIVVVDLLLEVGQPAAIPSANTIWRSGNRSNMPENTRSIRVSVMLLNRPAAGRVLVFVAVGMPVVRPTWRKRQPPLDQAGAHAGSSAGAATGRGSGSRR